MKFVKMKYSKPLLLLMFVLSWLSFPLIGKESIKRFLPAGLFISLIVTIEDVIARKRKWWWWYEKIIPNLSGIVPFLWGPFLIGSMWILKLTYGRFTLYTIINFFVDSIFTFFMVDWLKKLGIASLIRLPKYQLSMLFFVKSLLLYSFQYIKEKIQYTRY
ncbi:hypothetical protein [Virgibacillus sp. 6R]|uniref:hypothetical protein n=1 Tax=Metabacillus sp. 22489 TaxID=3453928 RepID=UPI002107EBB2